MSQAIAVNLSDALYEQVQAIADASDQTIQVVVADSLTWFLNPVERLRGDITASLTLMSLYPRSALVHLINPMLVEPQFARLRTLTDQSRTVGLGTVEETELAELIDIYDHYVQVRTEALIALQARGEDITVYRQTDI